jgi:hypothetical protein
MMRLKTRLFSTCHVKKACAVRVPPVKKMAKVELVSFARTV